jgi:hypothetical protein
MTLFAALTALGAVGQLEGLDLFMMILGTPALVWFTVLTMHYIGLFWFSKSVAIQFIKKNNPMSKKKDPDVENFFRIRRIVQTLSETFGANLVVPHTIICLVGLSACVAGLSAGKAEEVSLELLLLGIFFAVILYNILSIGGSLTADLDRMFEDRTIHTMELLKAHQGTFKNALLNLSSAATNDILCKCYTLTFRSLLWMSSDFFFFFSHVRLTLFLSQFDFVFSVDVSNRMVSFHTMMFTLFATAGDDKMSRSISFTAAGISLRRIHAIVALTVSLGALVCAGGVSLNLAPAQ